MLKDYFSHLLILSKVNFLVLTPALVLVFVLVRYLAIVLVHYGQRLEQGNGQGQRRGQGLGLGKNIIYFTVYLTLFLLLAPQAGHSEPIDLWHSPRLAPSDRELGTLYSRGDNILGGTRTVVTRNDARIEISRYSEESDSGRVTIHVAGNAQGEAVFTWDGDASHHTTSSLGLDCVDLTRNRDHFFLLKDVVLVRMFGKSSQPPPRALEVEVQAWSGDDATGQRYSRGIVRRLKALPVRDLIIPFSTLINNGPHGGWNPKCVGALRLTFRLPSSGERTVVSFGSFTTSGGRTEKKE